MITLDNKTLYIVSDLHMGDGSKFDDFAPYVKLFNNFLNMVDEDPNGVLIIDGDIFELWQFSSGDVCKAYFDLIKRLIEMKTIFIVGNHDIDLFGFIDFPLEFSFLSQLVKNVQTTRGGKKIRIVHGHEFDIFNDPSKSLFMGKIVSMLVGHYKKENKDFERWAEKYLEPIFRRLSLFAMNFYSRFFGKSQSQVEGKLSKILAKYHKKNPDVFIVSGHTHKPGWLDDWYVNTGSWEGTNEQHYAKIMPDGSVTLYKYPENTVVTKQYNS